MNWLAPFKRQIKCSTYLTESTCSTEPSGLTLRERGLLDSSATSSLEFSSSSISSRFLLSPRGAAKSFPPSSFSLTPVEEPTSAGTQASSLALTIDGAGASSSSTSMSASSSSFEVLFSTTTDTVDASADGPMETTGAGLDGRVSSIKSPFSAAAAFKLAARIDARVAVAAPSLGSCLIVESANARRVSASLWVFEPGPTGRFN